MRCLGCTGAQTCSWQGWDWLVPPLTAHWDVEFGETGFVHLWEGSGGAPGVLGEQPGVCYGKRDSVKPANQMEFAREGFQQDGQSPSALRGCAWQQPVSHGTGSPSALRGCAWQQPIPHGTSSPRAHSSSPSPMGLLLLLHAAPWTMRGVGHCSLGQALHPLKSNQQDLFQCPSWEQQCCCQAPGSAHPLLESSPPQDSSQRVTSGLWWHRSL